MKSRNKFLMRVAQLVETQATCDRNHVGAIIALDGRVVGTGYNGAPAGMPHCDHTCNCGSIDKYTDRISPCANDCASVVPCKLAVHAEANVIAFCAKYGLSTHGATLYTTMSPCYACSQLIINAGLVGVIYGRPYRDLSGVKLLTEAGINCGQYVETA